jgi:hypothetical protein
MLVNDSIRSTRGIGETMMTTPEVQGTVAERLTALGDKGVVVEIAGNERIQADA